MAKKTALKLEYWPVDKLKPYERNPRKNDAVVSRMVKSIDEFGFVVPILAKSDGSVIDGHLRLKAAVKQGIETAPVVVADHMTPAQVKAFRIMANQSANWAKWDMPALKLELEELELEGFDMSLTGFDDKFFDSLEVSDNLNLDDDDSQGGQADDDDEGDDDRPSPPVASSSQPNSKIPLSIVVSGADAATWNEYKESIGVRSDSSAFKELLKTVSGA